MPKELKKDEKKETASNSKLDTIRTKQYSKILNEKGRDIKDNTSNKNTANNLNNTIIPKHSNIANSKLNQTLNLKLNLDMINKGIHNINKRGNLMTPKMRKTTYSNFNSNVANTTGKKIDNTRLLRKSETAKKNLTSNTVTNYKVSNTITNINTNTSIPILFSEENHDQENNFNKENMPKTKNSEKTGISTVNKVTFLKPKPQTAKLRHKSPSQISANTNNDKKISLANSASASANNFISDKIIKKRDNTPKLNILSKKSKSPSSKLKMNKSNSNSNLISQNYLPNHTNNSNLTHTLTSYDSNSKKSLLKTNTCTFSNNDIKAKDTNFNSNSNKLFKYTEKIIKELEESKIRDDNYLETDTEVNFDNNYNYDYNYNEDDLRIKNVELSEINNILNIEDEKNTKIKIEKNYLSNDKFNRQLHTAKNQSHSNLKVLYNTLNGKVENKKVSNNLNISPLKESNKNSRINLTKKINSKNNKLDLDTKTTRPKSESKRKETPLGNRINNILISNNQSNKNIKKEIKRSNTLKPLKESHSSLNYLTHRRESSRPKSSIKRDLVDSKLNEGSLSTEASSIFRGRFEDYAIGKEIGKGAYAIVKQGLHKPSNKKVAIKIYDKVKLLDTQRKNSVKREIQILKRLDHQNIVKLHEVIDNSKQVRKL